MKKAIPGTRSFKSLVLLLLVSGLLLFALGYYTVSGIESFLYGRVQVEAQRFSKSYATNLETAMQADSIINTLLSEKLLTAGEIAASYEGALSNKELKRIAQATRVDEIYEYNPLGVIEYSASGKYIGWKTPQNHSVDRFQRSDKDMLVEEIRKDSESDIYYKYAYVKRLGGRFVQVGVLAETIYDFLDGFDMQRLLAEMEADSSISYASFMNGNMEILAQTGTGIEPDFSGAAYNAVMNDREYVEPISMGNTYRIAMPVFINQQKLGTLVLHYDVTDTQRLVGQISWLGQLVLIMIYGMILIFSIVSSLKNRQLKHYAYHQPLTDLPNSRYFEQVLRHDADNGNKNNRAIMLVNYKNFKQVNMYFGYQYGEQVIKDLAGQLKGLGASGYQLFHLTTDRFLFYVSNYQDRLALCAFCQQIIKALRVALPSMTVGGNIGVVEAAYFQYDSEILVKHAMLAAEHVDASEPFGFAFYSSDMEAQLQRERDVERELTAASVNEPDNGLYLMYQPIVCTESGKIEHMEALARLKSEKLGEVSPAEFIPIAEKTQLIIPLGKYILREACRFLRTLHENGHEDISITVNISAIQLMRDDFVPDLMKTVADAGADSRYLIIELTESIFAQSTEQVNAKLALLKSHGIRTAIDDFGTGYSSLAMERDLDVYCLKVDRSFISRLSGPSPEKNITGDIISMAHRMGHMVVAEGVENQMQLEHLKQAGCDYLQGFLFSKPLRDKDILLLLQRKREEEGLSA